MRVIETDLAGVRVLEPVVHRDDRGFFLESFRADRLDELGISDTFVQDNHSRSAARTLRGLHWQWRRPQAKLIRVVAGAIFDVVVDIRRKSPTFGRWIGVNLTSTDFRQLYVPVGFAHGFATLTDRCEVQYKQTGFYDPKAEGGIAWNDSEVAIQWPYTSPTLSAKDQRQQTLVEYRREPAFR